MAGGPGTSVDDPSPDELLVRAFVADLMAWRAHLNHVDKLEAVIERPLASTNFSAMLVRGCTAGVLGTGNSGSKGVWSGDGPVDALIDAAEARETLALVDGRDAGWCAKLDAMPTELAQLAVWVRDSTQGEGPKPQRDGDPPGYVIEYPAEGKRPARRVTGLSLAQIVGLSSAEPAQRDRWEAKMRIGDSGPARLGTKERGGELLLACARAWFVQPA